MKWGLWCTSPIPKGEQRSWEDRSGWYFGYMAGGGKDGRLERPTREGILQAMRQAQIPTVSSHGWRYEPKKLPANGKSDS